MGPFTDVSNALPDCNSDNVGQGGVENGMSFRCVELADGTFGWVLRQ